MQNADIVRMANQIAAYFEAYPRAEALAGITGHIKNFWSPRMRKQLDELVGDGGEGLSPLVVTAVAPKGKEPAAPAHKEAMPAREAGPPKEQAKAKNGGKAKAKA